MSDLGTQYKNQVKWSCKESIVYTITKLGQMVLKGVNWVHNDKISSYVLERSNCVHIVKIRLMVLKGVNWVNNTKIKSYGLERSQFATECKNLVKWS